MKRVYNYFLSLLLLMFAGVTSVMAQGYEQGDLITTEEAAASQDILFYSQGSHGSGFMTGTGAFTTAITNNSIYRLEATGAEVDGHKTYRIKQVKTGLYVKAYVLPNDAEDSSDQGGFDSGNAIDMTASADDALIVTCTAAVKHEPGSDMDDPYSFATEGKGGEQDLSYAAFVLRAVGSDIVQDHQYFNHISVPCHANYTDTNAWHFYTINEVQGKDKLLAYTTAYYGTSNEDPAITYPAGTTIGSYDATLVNAAHDVWQEAYNALQVEGAFPLTDEQVNDLCARIESTIAALQAPGARKGLTNGRYIISDSRETKLYLTNATVDNKDAWACSAFTVPEPLDASVANYIWEVEVVGQDSIYLKHLTTGLYAQGTMADDHHYALGADPKPIKVDYPTTSPRNTFWLVPATGQRACTNNAGWVLSWMDVNDPGCHFQFVGVDVDDATLAQWKVEAQQKVLNETLSAAYTSADALYKAGTTYGRPEGFTYDNVYTTEGKLVSPGEGADATEKEANTHWWANKKQGNEGTYEALVDLNDTTYFHSNWSEGEFTPSVTKNHFLVAQLDQPVSGDIYVKLTKRVTGNDFPLQFAVYGSNDFDHAAAVKKNADNGNWVFQGYADISYTDSIQSSGRGGNNLPDGVGVAFMHLDGSYKYIKLAATKTVYNFNPNDKNNKNGFLYNRGYFCIAQMNIWPTTGLTSSLSREYNELMTAAPDVYKKLGEEIKKSAEQLAAGKATKDQITALNAAVEEFNNNLPNPERVPNAIKAAKAFLDAANASKMIGTELAQYGKTEATNLQTVLDKYATFDKVDLASINAAVKEINDAYNAFKGSVNLPEAGQYYVIRSASKKVISEEENKKSQQGYVGALYNAIVYSANNNNSAELSDAASSIHFVFANHSSEVTTEGESSLDAMMGQLTDSVDFKKDASFVWKAEQAQDGKMILRNVATGMYLTGANGKMYQSTTATPLAAEGVAAKIFRFNLGENANGVTQYMNTKGATGTVVAWKDADDENSKWQISKLNDGEFATKTYVIKNVKQGNYYAATLPVTVNADEDAILYTVAGINTEDNTLVLAEAEEVEAGVPFVYYADNVVAKNSTVGNLIFGCDDLTSAEYVYEPKEGFGMVGTLCEPVKIDENAAYLNTNTQKVVAGSTNTTIGVNSAYFTGIAATDEAGEATIELGKGVASVLTGIDATKVTVLPSVVDVYSINGQLVHKNVKAANATKNLPAGVYVIGGKKVLVK